MRRPSRLFVDLLRPSGVAPSQPDRYRKSPPANIGLHGLTEAVFRGGASKAGGAEEVLAHRDGSVVLFGDLQHRLATFTVSPVAAMCW